MHTAFASKSSAHSSLMQKAEQAYQRHDLAACLAASQTFLRQNPQHVRALTLTAHAQLESGNTQAALSSFELLGALQPENFKLLLDIAKICIRCREYDKARQYLRTCSDMKPDDAAVDCLLGLCHEKQGQASEAMQCYSSVIERHPQMVQAYAKLAALLFGLQQYPQALEVLDIGLQFNPQAMDLLRLKAPLMVQQGRMTAALKLYESLDPQVHRQASVQLEHANLLASMKQVAAAEEKYLQLIADHPDNGPALLHFGKLLFAEKRYEQALNTYERYLGLHPEDVTALKNIANIYCTLRDFSKSNEYFKRAYRANPRAPHIAGGYLYSMSFLCDWTDHEEVLKTVKSDIGHVSAFLSLVFQDDPAQQRAIASRLAAEDFKSTGILGPLKPHRDHDKIRLGYYSSDFYNHATVMLIEGVLQSHDRSRFELHAFSLDARKHDEYTERVKKLFDQYHEVSALSDRAVTLLSRQLEIDIAIDLKGYTEGSRTAIFAERAAPVQINFLGYPGSMGAPFMDYMIADPYTIPLEHQKHYAEKILYMPGCYQPNNPDRPRPQSGPRPAELPEGCFVFCCFNNTHKISPEVFGVWLSILEQAPNSVLWMLRTTPQAEHNILQYTASKGIDPSRIVLARHQPEAQHLTRLSHADLFLDTYPYNAHTTASDALWAGVPLVTMSGQSFASRVAGSILNTAGLPELIAHDPSEYEKLALDVYRNPEKLQRLKQKISGDRLKNSLYDAAAFARHLEKLLTIVHESQRV